MLRGLKTGIDLALWLTGLMPGAFQSEAMEGGIAEKVTVQIVERATRPAPLVKLESMNEQSMNHI